MLVHRSHMPTPFHGVMNSGLWFKFYNFLIAEVFLNNISLVEKIVWKSLPVRGPQSVIVRFPKTSHFTFNCNKTLWSFDKSLFLRLKIQSNRIWKIIKNIGSNFWFYLLRPPQKRRDFEVFLKTKFSSFDQFCHF